MARIGMILVIGAIIASMIIALIFFMEYRPSVLEAVEGQDIIIGPIKYTLTYEGIQTGIKKIDSERTFIKIGIMAENLQGETIVAEKKQFSLLDKKGAQTQATHGDVAESSKITAYFPLAEDEFDEDYEYKVMIRPTKEQRSTELGIVCITNCQ